MEYIHHSLHNRLQAAHTDTTPKIIFKRTSTHATLPTRATPRSAGLDLYSAYDYTIAPGTNCLIRTDLQMTLPPNTYGRIAPRSGLALLRSICVGGGVVDEDYRGHVGVILFNLGEKPFHVKQGDRIAQLICEKIEYPQVVEDSEAMDATTRGEAGFGSTGV
ncbi:trimeric dUTPase [Vombatid gammaherpesvirus 1]|uniref:dUTP diphosphatase n=1 Tax=Vombatid gammaherpesvirus 1 TaxID=2052651 RepID=A0A3Q8J748_9GAMA|nr:trimeric dUTPase [Vombatid gammaherpesvirus 1]AZB49116.1 trimeric dUTPase [Vombatid gammaherpesvirus 1]